MMILMLILDCLLLLLFRVNNLSGISVSIYAVKINCELIWMFIAANCELRSHFILITEQKSDRSFDTLALNLSVLSYSFDPLNLQVPSPHIFRPKTNML